MSVTINHQTNDISATSGSLTIDGAAAGGGGGSTLVYENETDGNSVSAIDYTSSAGSDLCGFKIFIMGLRPNSSSKLVLEPLDASGAQIGVNSTVLGYQYSDLYNGAMSTGHVDLNGRSAVCHFRNNKGAAHGSTDDYAGATGEINVSWSRAEDRRKWQMFASIAYVAGDGRNFQNVSHINMYGSNRITDTLSADLGGFRLRNSDNSTFQAGSVFVTEVIAG